MPAETPPDRSRRTLPVVAAVLGTGAVAVVAAGTNGGWGIADRFGLFGSTPAYPTRTPVPQSAAPTPSAPPTPSDVGHWLVPVLWVLAVVAAFVVAFVVWRVLPRAHRKTRGSALGAHALGQPVEDPAPVVQQGLGAAQHLLATVTDPTDAVLAAWVALEQAADRSGHPRRPADTPTEFTVEVLTATPADRAAVRTLLGLYHRARFSDAGVGSEAVTQARECLDALARSWSAVVATQVTGPEPTAQGRLS